MTDEDVKMQKLLLHKQDQDFLDQMLKIGGYSFPVHGHTPSGSSFEMYGLSARDYFATAAMQAEVSHLGLRNLDETARQAYAMADAMLRVRGV